MTLQTVPCATPKLKLIYRLGLMLVIPIALWATSAVAAPTDSPIVRPDPVQASVAVGETVTINLYVQDVVDLYGVDVRLSFDSEVLQVVDAAPATDGVQITPLDTFLKPDFVARKKACNSADPSDPECAAGGLVWYAATQVNPSQPVSGSGPLAALTFRRIKAGDAVLKVNGHELVTRTGTVIPSQTLDGVITLETPRHQVYLPLVLR